MGGSIADLVITVGKGIKAFNRHDRAGVAEILDRNITVVSIYPKRRPDGGPAKKTVTGPTAIDSATDDQFRDNPTFTLVNLNIDLKGAPDGEATEATVTGVAKWKDEIDTQTLQFTFECAYKDKWVYTKISGTRV